MHNENYSGGRVLFFVFNTLSKNWKTKASEEDFEAFEKCQKLKKSRLKRQCNELCILVGSDLHLVRWSKNSDFLISASNYPYLEVIKILGRIWLRSKSVYGPNLLYCPNCRITEIYIWTTSVILLNFDKVQLQGAQNWLS